LEASALEIIGTQKVWTFSARSEEVVSLNSTSIRKNPAHPVRNYMDLATKVAELQFRNRDFVMMFRGQNSDFRNKSGNTSLKASLLRAADSTRVPKDQTIQDRFTALAAAELALVAEYRSRKMLGRERLERQRILRWSILQHYEICKTPLLDVTQSLRIAASFASHNSNSEAYVFVLGIPNISGAITASAEAGLQVVRLAGVCPPSAVRPHIQEGYLLGEYPDFSSADQKALYSHYEMDFGRRLIAKFRFEPNLFWNKSGNFPQVGEKALYPRSAQDPMCALAEAVISAIA
jgi:hypothetical protein